MLGVIGIDSREFRRDVTKSNGDKGEFRSVLGVAIRTRDYDSFDKKYLNPFFSE